MNADILLRATIWLSVFAWAAAEVLACGRQPRAARAAWTSGAVLLAIHTGLAFHYWHAWSHAGALAATAAQSARQTGVAAGWGLYLNYAMLAAWLADAAWWWAAPRGYAARSRMIDRAVFAFFAFMIVNGAVVFATAPMRYAGAAAVIIAVAARVARAARAPAAL